MPAGIHAHWRSARVEWPALFALMMLGLSACQADIKDGVFTCNTSVDCPSGLHCHPQAKRCTRQLFDSTDSKIDTDRGASSDGGLTPHRDAASADAPADAGDTNIAVPAMRADPQRSSAADAGSSTRPAQTADGGSSQAEASSGGARAAAGSGGSRAASGTGGSHAAAGSGETRAAAGSGGARSAAGSGGSPAAAGSGGEPRRTGGTTAEAGSGPPDPPTDCPRATYCYGFEAGPLGPSGALWPSPSDGRGGLPVHDELTTAPFPASSGNPMLVSRPSSLGSWPKATVGFSGPEDGFSKLVVSFDYAAGDKLVMPNPRVILFRFVGTPARNGDSVNVGVLGEDAMLEVQMAGPDPLSAIGRAAAPGVLTHVVATFTRSSGSCMVSIAYGTLPLKAAAFPCDVDRWQIELGLDLLETPPDQYDDEYVAYFDNLRVSTTP